MADRGSRGRGRGQGRFQQQPFPNRGGGGNRGGAQHGDRGRGNYGNQGGGPLRGQYQGGGRGGRGQGVRIFTQNGQIHVVNGTVTNLEDNTIKQSLAEGIHQMSVKDHTGMPKRPAYGSKGRRVVLWANYFELLPSKTSTFNRYDVSIVDKDNDAPKGKKLERCMQILLQALPKTTPIATDYRKTLITPERLPFEGRTFTLQYSENDQQEPSKNLVYRAKVEFTGTLTFGDILEYLSSTDLARDSPSAKEEIFQAMNIIIASGMKSNSEIIAKKNKYFPAGKTSFVESWKLDSGLKAFRGFFMSVRAATGRILLNVQVQHVATWEEQSMSELLYQWFEIDRKKTSEVHHMIAGLTVEVTHLKNRIKRVTGLVTSSDGHGYQKRPRISSFEKFANADQVEFWREQAQPAKYITVAKHFKETHWELKFPTAPLLNVGSKSQPIYMPSEVCKIKRLQTYDKKLSAADTAEMIKFAVRSPADNAQAIVDNGIGLLRANSKQRLDAFGINVNPSMIVVTGRVLNAVSLQYQGNATVVPADASWNMRGASFNLGAKIPTWTYLWIKTETVPRKDQYGKVIRNQEGKVLMESKGGHFANQQQVDEVVDDFHKVLAKSGCKVNQRAAPFVLTLAKDDDVSQEIDKIFAEIVKRVQVLLVILPEKSTAIYNAVKRAGDIKYGIHTVSVVAHEDKFCKRYFKNFGPGIPNAQYHANVALKFNLKLGGRNQVLQAADRGFVGQGKTMLVGLDVTHPAPGSDPTAPSISSITASIDPHLSQWPADVAIQSRSKEMIEGLKNMFKSRLVLWRKHQSQYPEEIIVYRDGVGDSMYELVRTQELPLMREACSELYSPADTKAGKPYITIIICGKRHHTRFYPTDEKEADLEKRMGGTKCGTVVDRGITETRVWDFYLQAHVALKGTPRSAHYVVIHDEIFRRRTATQKVNDGSTAGQRAADELERLTHAMCYTFGRATKAVSLCPPAYYADIVCERARVWLSRVFDESSVVSSQVEVRDEHVRVHPRLQDSMFYL